MPKNTESFDFARPPLIWNNTKTNPLSQ